MEINNANQLPRIFYCRHMQPGTALYENDGMYLVDTDAMKNLIGSVGKKTIPVYIGHQDVNLKQIQSEACGFVSESFYNELDGWAWFKFIAVADSAFDAIKKGWGVSNAYLPSQVGGGGTKNNVPYKKEVLDGEFTHLAIVPDPRYEGACIMTPDEFKTYQENHKKKLAELKNSKEGKPIMSIFKMFKTERKEVTNAADANEFEINGKRVTLEEMINSLETAEKVKTEKHVVNGKEMTVEEIQNAFAELDNAKKKMKNKKKAKKNMSSTDDETDGESEWKEEGDDEIGADKKNSDDSEEDDCMANSDDDEEFEEMEKDIRQKNKKNRKMKKNSKVSDKDEGDTEVLVDDKYFTEMKNARLNAKPSAHETRVTLMQDGIARGKNRYGTKDGVGRITAN